MTILDKIVASKYSEVKLKKKLHPVAVMEQSVFFNRKPLLLSKALLAEGSSGIIAEYKRRSPSAGVINDKLLPQNVCHEYMNAGASAVSVLTDTEFFGGSSADLVNVREEIDIPVLRKDFIIDEYQVVEARSIGADVILLIAEILSPGRLGELYDFAGSMGLEVLVEIHDEKSIASIPPGAAMIGINSRNLRDFTVGFGNIKRLISLLPADCIKVAESGIRSVGDMLKLRESGFNAFLIGECFMRSNNPGEICRTFADSLKK